jgi:hypothetical protein
MMIIIEILYHLRNSWYHWKKKWFKEFQKGLGPESYSSSNSSPQTIADSAPEILTIPTKFNAHTNDQNKLKTTKTIFQMITITQIIKIIINKQSCKNITPYNIWNLLISDSYKSLCCYHTPHSNCRQLQLIAKNYKKLQMIANNCKWL